MARRPLKIAAALVLTLPLTLATSAWAMRVDVQLKSGCSIASESAGIAFSSCGRDGQRHALPFQAMARTGDLSNVRNLLGSWGNVWRVPYGQSAVDVSKLLAPGEFRPVTKPIAVKPAPTAGPTPVAANPEPGSVATFALGALLVGSRLRRRKRAAA